MRLFLGVDGGQSSTLTLIGDETGRVLGVGRAGPCNHATAEEGLKRFILAIRGSLRNALKDAGLDQERLPEYVFESAGFGLSGGPTDKDELTRKLVGAECYVIAPDAWTAHTGALAGEPGVIVIAGTGSIAFGRDSADKTARAGGWGYIFGDEGGGFDLVRQAVRATMRQEEGWGPATALTDLMLDATSSLEPNDMVHRLYGDEFPRDKVAAMAPLVDQAAAAGDAVAQEILKYGAQTLAAMFATVRGQLFGAEQPIEGSFIGGVFRSRVLLERFRMLVELDGKTKLIAPRFGPAAGALIEAYRAVGLSCTPQGVPEEKGAIS